MYSVILMKESSQAASAVREKNIIALVVLK